MELRQTQVLGLSHQQLHSVELLQLSTLELEAYIRELALDNPMVEPEEPLTPSAPPSEDDLLGKLRWLEDNDRQNQFYQQISEDELDPLARVSTDGGLEETLFRFLARQIDGLALDQETAQTVRYLASCLDDDGYFRLSLEDLSPGLGVPVPKLEHCLAILQALEPAGVGAGDLSQCLAFQLKRLSVSGVALDLVRDHLEELGKRRYRSIAAALGVSQDEVLAAERIIRELEPRPGNLFQRPEQVQYILPDVFVEEVEGRFAARGRRGERPPFQINGYYRDLLAQSGDQAVREYLTGKLHQAEHVLWAIGQRESTLLRCAQVIADRQSEFFRHGPQSMLPLRLADVARELDLHESTISRTVNGKYLQCLYGVYPMSYFFSRAATAETDHGAMGGTAARALLKQLIDQEDKTAPLSDQKLCQEMAAAGCPISRRTVAKYRDELGIASAFARRTLHGS